MVGREHELSEAVRFINGLDREGPDGMVFIWADAGIGKTRFVSELQKAIPYREFVVVQGDPSPGSSPFSDFLRRWFGLDPKKSAEENTAVFESVLEGLIINFGVSYPGGRGPAEREIRDIGEYLGYLLGLDPPAGTVASELEPRQRAEKIGRSLAVFFNILAALELLAVVLEDVQWFSPEDMDTARRIMSSSAGVSRVFIVTGRPDSSGNPPAPGEPPPLVPSVTLLLEGLPRDSLYSFVMKTGREAPGHELLDFLWKRAGGVPLFLHQTLDYLDGTGRYLKKRDGKLMLAVDADEIPANMRDMFHSRMLLMSPNARNAAVAASVLGTVFPERQLQGLTGLSLSGASALRRELEGILVMDRHEWSFAHVLLREWTGELATVDELAELHNRAGKMLEKDEVFVRSPSGMERVADHFLLGGDRRRAVRHLWRASAAYAEDFENETSARLFRMLIPMLEDPDRARAELELSDVYRNRGLLDRAAELLESTLERLPARSGEVLELRALVLLKLGVLKGSAGRLEDSERIIRECLGTFIECGDLENRAAAVRQLGTIMRSAGRMEEAADLLEESLRLARETADPKLICSALYWSVIACRQTGERERMEECTRELVSLAEASGSLRSIVMGYDSLMRLHIYRGEYEEAERVHGMLREAAERTADWAVLSTATSKMGIIHLRRGEYEEAAVCFDRCAELSGRTGNLRAGCAALGNLAHVSLRTGDSKGAMRYSMKLIDTAGAIGFRPGIMSGYARMGHVFMLRGDHESALECMQTQIEYAQKLRDVRNLSDGWASTAEIQFLLGDVPGALKSVDLAIEHSTAAEDAQLRSSQLFGKGRMLVLSGEGDRAAAYLEAALELAEGIRGREMLSYLCRLYLSAAGSTDEPERPEGELDPEAEAEVHLCRWLRSGDAEEAGRAEELLEAAGKPDSHPVFRALRLLHPDMR